MSNHSASPVTAVPGQLESLSGLLARVDPQAWPSSIEARELWDRVLLGPSRHLLCTGGKGVRGRVLGRAWELAGGGPEGAPEELPVAVGLLHLGSMIVDDIEDDSQTRRGRPTVHREFGVPLALNTGNWLYFLALATVAKSGVSDAVRLAILEEVSVALMRCHQGQALDLGLHVAELSPRELPELVRKATRLKTGTLVGVSARMGAIAAGAGDATGDTIEAFGVEVGMGLQMLDDWSAVSVPERIEKGREDVRLGRLTWPWAWLAEHGSPDACGTLAPRLRALSSDAETDALVAELRDSLAPVADREIDVRLGDALDGLARGLPGADLRAVEEDLTYLRGAFG